MSDAVMPSNKKKCNDQRSDERLKITLSSFWFLFKNPITPKIKAVKPIRFISIIKQFNKASYNPRTLQILQPLAGYAQGTM